MKIGGLQKLTLLDFPDRMAAIVFTPGCNFSCPFCFNADLVRGERTLIASASVLAFLKKRKNLLDGLVLTGGEPLLQPDIAEFIREVRCLGYQIKLDTNGSYPEALAKLLKEKLLDYVALDIKTDLNDYQKAIGMKSFDSELIKKTMSFLLRSGVPFEVRTTIVPGIHDEETLKKMAKEIRSLVGKRIIPWYWQNFQPKNCLDPKWEKIKPYSREKLTSFLATAKKIYPNVVLREE